MSDGRRRRTAGAVVASLMAVGALLAPTVAASEAFSRSGRASAAPDPAAASAGRDSSRAQDPILPGPVTPPAKGRVVLVGDSIMLGARPQLEAAFAAAGYDVVVDAAESRSTLAGSDVLAGHLAWGADAAVVMLGANDAGNPDTYRTRVRAVLDRAALVPHVYWLTIPEVRSYYPAANQVLREELATRPGAEVLEWHAVSGGAGMTAGDGLHLTGQGADAMAWFVAVNTIADLEPPPTTTVPADPVTSDGAATSEGAATDSPPPDDTDAGAGAGGGSESEAAVPGEGAPGSATADSSAAPGPGSGQVDLGVRRVERAAEVAAESSVWRLATPALQAVLGVLVLLGVAGVGLAGWSLWRTR